MVVLREIHNVRQVPGEHRRRWFTSATMDLIVWLDDDGAPIGFQLCYDKGEHERALTFEVGGGLAHAAVDDGEARAELYKETPVLVSGGYFDARRVQRLFVEAKGALPEEISTFVAAALAARVPPLGPTYR